MKRSTIPVPPAPTALGMATPFTLGFHVVAALLAVALPTLLSFNLPPSATFLNQAASLIGWGLWLLLLAALLPATWGRPLGDGLAALLGALGLLLLAALVSPLWAGLPATLSLSSVGMIAAAMLVVLMAALLQRHGHGRQAFEAFCWALRGRRCAQCADRRRADLRAGLDRRQLARGGQRQPRGRQPAPGQSPEQPAAVVAGGGGVAGGCASAAAAARGGHGGVAPDAVRRGAQRFAHRHAGHADAGGLGSAGPAPLAPARRMLLAGPGGLCADVGWHGSSGRRRSSRCSTVWPGCSRPTCRATASRSGRTRCRWLLRTRGWGWASASSTSRGR